MSNDLTFWTTNIIHDKLFEMNYRCQDKYYSYDHQEVAFTNLACSQLYKYICYKNGSIENLRNYKMICLVIDGL